MLTLRRGGRLPSLAPPFPFRSAMRQHLVTALILIALGLLFLARNLGWTDLDLSRLLSTWWPLILIAVGVSLLFRRGK